MLYYAYGANTNTDNMRGRCPKAKLIGALTLPDYELTFRNVADIERKIGAHVEGVLWDITNECENALDIYEGVESGLYRKEYFPVKAKGNIEDVMFYKMNSMNYGMPSEHYFNTILQGYFQNDLDVNYLYGIYDSLESKIQKIDKQKLIWSYK